MTVRKNSSLLWLIGVVFLVALGARYARMAPVSVSHEGNLLELSEEPQMGDATNISLRLFHMTVFQDPGGKRRYLAELVRQSGSSLTPVESSSGLQRVSVEGTLPDADWQVLTDFHPGHYESEEDIARWGSLKRDGGEKVWLRNGDWCELWHRSEVLREASDGLTRQLTPRVPSRP